MDEAKRKGTILIVDDEPNTLWFISKVFQPMGFETLTAGSGLEALKIVEECAQKLDLVLLDLRMPGMGGLEVLKSIHKHHEELPVIVLTALSDKRKECEELGVDAFITKPYSLEDLYQRVSAVVEREEESKTSTAIPDGYIPSAKVMIVDDEKEVCEILSESLSQDVPSTSYEVRYALSGDEALRLANQFEPDIAIVDIKMQHMWGDELIEKFKQGEAYSPKDFIIYTSADIPEQRKKAKKMGYKFFSKPAKMEDLIEVLEKICIRHKLLKKI
jgi:two-component system KDP operon response regulator KdpE